MEYIFTLKYQLADHDSNLDTLVERLGPPDLVGLTDVAGVVGISRLAHRATFPMPVHEGSASIWNLAEVLDWLGVRGGYQFDAGVLETAKVASAVNIAKETIRHPLGDHRDMELLTAQAIAHRVVKYSSRSNPGSPKVFAHEERRWFAGHPILYLSILDGSVSVPSPRQSDTMPMTAITPSCL